MQYLKELVKRIAKPRETLKEDHVQNGKAAISSLFVNINVLAGEVMFPKEILREEVIQITEDGVEGCVCDLTSPV